MKIRNQFDLICDRYQLEGTEKLSAFNRFKDGGINAVLQLLNENGNKSFAEDDRAHFKAIIKEREKVSACKSVSILKRHYYLGKRTKEGD